RLARAGQPQSWRALAAQGALLLAVLALIGWLGHNAASNLAGRGVTFGFAFLGNTAGFDIPFHLIPWSTTDTYGRALAVVLLNTPLVSALGIVAATVFGLALGIMRLAPNWLVRNTALGIIELVRNTPQLL